MNVGRTDWEEVRARRMASARRPGPRHGGGLVERRMIDARPRLQEHADGRLLFRIGERGRIVVDPELNRPWFTERYGNIASASDFLASSVTSQLGIAKATGVDS